MELIVVNILVLTLVCLFVIGYIFIYKPLQKLYASVIFFSKLLESYRNDIKNIQKALISVEKRIDEIFVIDKPLPPSPNEATQPFDGGVEFSEDNPLDLPKELKFEIEGGDSVIPPAYNS